MQKERAASAKPSGGRSLRRSVWQQDGDTTSLQEGPDHLCSGCGFSCVVSFRIDSELVCETNSMSEVTL